MGRTSKKASGQTKFNLEMQTELCRIFENSFTSIEDCVSRILVPVFHRNKFERAGCGIPEHRHDVEKRAESRHVRSVYHVGTVDICAQKVNIFETLCFCN